MPLNSAELELNPGQSPADSLSALSQKLFMRNIQTQRLQLAQEGKREQAGTFLKDYLNPAHYLTGSDYDPVLTTKLQAAMDKGADLAEKGADIPSLLMNLGPMVSDINQYTTKAKVIDQHLKEGAAQLKQYAGYDQEKVASEARLKAFHEVDPKTGAYGALKDINAVDPSLDYIQQAIKDNPERVTTNKGFADYAAKIPKDVNLLNETYYDDKGNMSSQKLKTTGQNYMVPERNAQGQTTGLVPAYDHANDGGQELQHEFTDAKGNKTKAPVRLLDEKLFDTIMDKQPDAADNIRGQVMQHLKEYNAGNDEPITLDSPKAKLVARALAYDEMKNASLSSIENAEVNSKPSAAEIQLHVFGNKYQQAYDRTLGHDDANTARGIGPGAKTNTIDAIHQIAQNNPQFLHGDASEQQGQAVMDVTNMLPKAQLKFGAKAADTYKNVFYNPSTHSFLLKKRDGTFDPEVTQKDIPELLYKIATANGVPNGTKYVDKSLAKYGYANGAYTNTEEAPDLTEPLNKAKAMQITHGLDELDARGTVKTLKGIHTPDGEVTGVDVRGGFKTALGANKYAVSVKGPDGKVQTVYKADRPALEQYLRQSTLKAGPTTDEKKNAENEAKYGKQ